MNCLRKYLIPLCLLIGLLIAGPDARANKKRRRAKADTEVNRGTADGYLQDEVCKNQSQQIIEGATNPINRPKRRRRRKRRTSSDEDQQAPVGTRERQRGENDESNRQNDYDESRSLRMNLDILTRAGNAAKRAGSGFRYDPKQNSVGPASNNSNSIYASK
ncbi:MAG: hypothetical protein IPJ30_12670 [Acidobacteria bacterium]|nr:hypothetical protein [Acidobacteriota bacterium]